MALTFLTKTVIEILKIFSNNRNLKSCFLFYWNFSLRLLYFIQTPFCVGLEGNCPLNEWLAVVIVNGCWRRREGTLSKHASGEGGWWRAHILPIYSNILSSENLSPGDLCVCLAGPHNRRSVVWPVKRRWKKNKTVCVLGGGIFSLGIKSRHKYTASHQLLRMRAAMFSTKGCHQLCDEIMTYAKGISGMSSAFSMLLLMFWCHMNARVNESN